MRTCVDASVREVSSSIVNGSCAFDGRFRRFDDFVRALRFGFELFSQEA